MRGPKLTYLILLLLFIGQNLCAEVFTVINPNPAGPGSLRDAIERANANGTREMDYIYFNIPDRTRDKTIYIRPTALLPTLTSFITIDGSSQPGAVLGVSTAKIVVSIEGAYAGSTPLICFDLTQASNVHIYGLMLKANVADRSTGQPPTALYGIYTQGSSNIVIGAPGKGNVIAGWNKAVFNEYNGRVPHSGLITIQSNFFGIDTDGFSVDFAGRTGGKATNVNGVYIDESFGPARIGGNNDDEINYFNSSSTDIYIKGEYTSGTDRGLSIVNNRFGMGFRDVNLNSSTLTGIRLTHMSTWLAGFPPILVSKNVFGGMRRDISIQVDDMLPRFLINQNIIGYEENGQKLRDAYYGIGILVNNCENGIIGGNGGNLGNIIRYQSQGAVVLDATRDISIFQNSTYCNKKRAIEINNWFPFNNAARVKPFVTINQINELFGVVSGKAPRLSTIELFYDDDCPGCEGLTYFARTSSDANGNWSYRGALRGGNIIATASDQGNATSEYSAPEIDTTLMTKPAVTCNGQLASICGLSIVSGTRWQWEDAGGNILGTDTCLNNIGIGTYFLRLAIGTQSCEEVYRFDVTDSILKIDTSRRIDISHNRCGKNNGSIRGFQPVNASRWQWEDINGNIISTNIELNNVPAGQYRFRVFNRSCDTVSAYYEVRDVTPRIDATNPVITATTCTLSNGSITGISFSGAQYSSVLWIDEQRQVVGTTRDLLNIPAGRYKLLLRDLAEGCGDSTNYITVPATVAPSLDTSRIIISPATCNQVNGSIRNITATNTSGTVVYRWVNAQNTVVATTADLLNAGPGLYRLKMKDGGSCDTVVTRAYEIVNNGNVQLDSAAVVITPAGCTRINGAIRGLRVSGADSWEWRNVTTNAVVSNTQDLINMPAGNYRLYAVNNRFGCTIESRIYSIGTASMIPLTVLQSAETDASCNINNGSIRIGQLSADQSLFSFKWLRDSTLNMGSSFNLTDLSPATYHLIATDTNGCEKAVYKRTIVMQSMPVLNENNVVVKPDTCGFKTGSVTGITVSGGTGTLRYSWTNINNDISGNSPALNNVQNGIYRLRVTDANNCEVSSAAYVVDQFIKTLPAPQYDNQTIPRHTDATLRIKNPAAGSTYELYDAATGALLDQNNSGIFIINKVADDRRLFVKQVSGPCSSGNTEVSIKVIDITRLDIPNIFSPNGDGVNDQFRIKITGYFRLDGLKIFNRWGQPVFETKDLSIEWDGTQSGKPLPVATYYWLIEGLDVYGQRVRRTGSVTIVR